MSYGTISRMSLATRTAAVVSVLFIATCGALVFRALQVFEAQFIALVGQNEEALLREYARTLNGSMAASQTTLSSAASLVDAEMLVDPISAKRFLDGRTFLRARLPEGLYLLDKKGRLLASAGGGANSPRDLLTEERELAQRTMSTGLSQLSSAFSSPAQKSSPIFAMSAPVLSDDGRVIGALMGSFALLDRNYAGVFANRKVGHSGYLYMTTRSRIMLMHPKLERILETTSKPGQNIGLDRALDQGLEGSIETVNSTGVHALATFVGIPNRDWLLASNFPMTEVSEPFWQSLRELAGGAAISASLLFVLVLVIVKRLMRPVRQLTERLLELGKGVPHPIDFPVGGELGVMAGAFNQMVHALGVSESARNEREFEVRELNQSLEQRVHERTLALEHANTALQQTLDSNLLMRDELVRREKLAALGSLVAGVSHELNTPIGNSLTVASTMEKRLTDFSDTMANGLTRSALNEFVADAREGVDILMRSLRRSVKLVSSFKQVAVDQTSENRREFQLHETINDILLTLAPTIREKKHSVTSDIPHGIHLQSYPGPLGQVIANLINNALIHGFSARSHGTVVLHASSTREGWLQLAVQDDGIGIAPEHLARVFDPFFTTRLGQGGSGLGLNIVYNTVTEMLGGRIRVESVYGQGACFTIELPCVAPATNVV